MLKYKITYQGDLRTKCRHLESGQEIQTDAPKDNRGKGEYFSPTDLLAVSLGSCILTIMGIYAVKKNVDLKGALATVEKEMSRDLPRRIIRITVDIIIPASPDEETKKYLEMKALECPVHHSLHPDMEKNISFSWGSSAI